LPFAPDLAAVCLAYHRTSARVLWDLAESHSTRLEPLYEDLVNALSEYEHPFWRAQGTFSVVAFDPRSVAAGSRQVVGVVKNALIEVGRRRGCVLTVSPERPDFLFHARSFIDEQGSERLVVSLDLAGREMHQRGYRFKSGVAPLREDLAALLVMLGRFDAKNDVFIDPMAGSGTLVAEAALMAAGKPLWMSGRSPAAAHYAPVEDEWPRFKKPLFGDSAPRLYAAELEPEIYELLGRTLQTAGVHSQVDSFCGDFRDWDLRPEQLGNQGLILSNPPYGGRLGASQKELGHLYRDLGKWCRQFRGYRAAFILGEPPDDDDEGRGGSVVGLFLSRFGAEPRIKKPLRNGPLRAQFLLFDL
jgi:23S rRNA G2445 N2-methylase RlmL